jgi:membrane protease YdiL (CAAX protease family)
MSSFVARRPLAFSVLAVFVPLVTLTFVRSGFAALGLPELASRVLAEGVFCGYVILLLWRLRWWREAGFTPPATRRRLVAYLPLLVLPLLALAGNGVGAASADRVIGFALFTLMVGFAEEGLMRGIVLRALLPGGAMRAAVLSSLIFGVGHLANIRQGASAAATIVQVVVATFLGIGFAGARVYAGTIWPAIAMHAVVDLVDVAGRGFALPTRQPMTLARAVIPIALTGLYAVYGWWLLRRVRESEPPFDRAGRQSRAAGEAGSLGGV